MPCRGFLRAARSGGIAATTRAVPLLAALWMIAGCAAPQGPEAVHIDAGGYADAFEAAERVAHEYGLPLVLRDARAGLIETEFADAPTMLEPWNRGNTSFDQAVEHTINQQRRRARFEFKPAIDPEPAEAADHSGPDFLDLQTPHRDLTTYPGDMELRVRVFVDQANTPGRRRDYWSRSLRSTTRIVAPDESTVPARFWTPVTRDEALERRLLAAVLQQLLPDENSPPS